MLAHLNNVLFFKQVNGIVHYLISNNIGISIALFYCGIVAHTYLMRKENICVNCIEHNTPSPIYLLTCVPCKQALTITHLWTFVCPQ